MMREASWKYPTGKVDVTGHPFPFFSRVTVEIAKGTPHGRDRDRWGSSSSRRDRSPRGGGGGRDRKSSWVDKYGPPTRTNFKITVENLSSRVSWQVIEK